MVTHIRARWLLHVIFVPTGGHCFLGRGVPVFYVVDEFEGSMPDGMSMLIASCYLVLALLVHAIALGELGVTRIRRFFGGR
jgi:membrane-associated phospholipid phosphatase